MHPSFPARISIAVYLLSSLANSAFAAPDRQPHAAEVSSRNLETALSVARQQQVAETPVAARDADASERLSALQSARRKLDDALSVLPPPKATPTSAVIANQVSIPSLSLPKALQDALRSDRESVDRPAKTALATAGPDGNEVIETFRKSRTEAAKAISRLNVPTENPFALLETRRRRAGLASYDARLLRELKDRWRTLQSTAIAESPSEKLVVETNPPKPVPDSK